MDFIKFNTNNGYRWVRTGIRSKNISGRMTFQQVRALIIRSATERLLCVVLRHSYLRTLVVYFLLMSEALP